MKKINPGPIPSRATKDLIARTDLIPQRSIVPRTDLREMLRQYIVARNLKCMAQAATRRKAAIAGSGFVAYRQAIRAAVHKFYGRLPAGKDAEPPKVTAVSAFEHDGFRIENVLFDSFHGWQVNATVYVPTSFQPPFPAVVVPVGHSGKQFEPHQLPCQLFARCGFLAVSFDPPGQASEKQPGNDHFNDGVRDYLLGETSSRYFIADAIRCVDYLATRRDVELSRGVAMTGVSGGGTTTTFAALLDPRIAVSGLSCCVTSLADLDITQCYAGCPETHMLGRYAGGVDEVDLICAAAPVPCLLMAGELDVVFRVEDTRCLANEVAACYRAVDRPECFSFFVDKGKGHGYSLRQAREFARFMRRWLCGDAHSAIPDIPDDSFSMLPYKELRCFPRTDVNMRTRATAQADALSAQWDRRPRNVCRAASDVAGVRKLLASPKAEVGAAFRVFTHTWRSIMLRPEPGIELPATFLTPWNRERLPTVLHFDDAGRHRLLHRQGLLIRMIRLLQEDRDAFGLLTVDLRGWGDTAPAMYPYEMAGWGSLDRYVTYASAALGDPIMAMRIRDGLAALSWLRTRPEVAPDRIVLTGCGLGGIVALHVAAIDGKSAGVATWDSLLSFRSLIEAERYPWPADTFLPRVLRAYDLPGLAAALTCPVCLMSARDGIGAPARSSLCAALSQPPRLIVESVTPDDRIIGVVQSILDGNPPGNAGRMRHSGKPTSGRIHKTTSGKKKSSYGKAYNKGVRAH
ncbi:MAG: acetylxylan esterase [Kiritimatiellaeota bacterium]|nr:acetylxylan esterase [Kiritimatiellota bacterium]